MEKPDISSTRTASCLVKITTDEAVLPLDEFAVDYLLRSSGVAGKAAREVLEISPDIAAELFEIEEVYSNVFPDSAGGTSGMGIPPDYQPWVSKYGTATISRSTRPTTPTPTRTPTRTPTTGTPRPRIPTTTPTRRTYSTRTTTPTRPRPTVTQPLPSTTEQTILFRLQVDLSQASTEEPIKPAAEEFMMALIENLRSALSGASEQYGAKLNKQLRLADEEAVRAERELRETQAKLRDISDSRDLSRTVILKDISSLRQRLQSTIMQRTSDETLYEATTKQIAIERDRRIQLVQNDPITREFESILQVHEKRMKDAQKLAESGSISEADLEDIKEKIIKARIDLAKRKEEILNPLGGLAIDATNEELASLSTKIALAQQEISSLEKQLKDAEQHLISADDYELLSLKAGIARQSLEETLLWRARLGRNIRSIQPPDVTVIGAE
ncbi:MAG: hypothetical protein GWN67_18675 [Phycisphaerae bacterium]|nr:hypothetical protein [Phycisphaerae bacterium]NIP53906.1 hypothetical protein [Phycisphaerae bacterium]NIS53068.1 hypothetical protein [Phycisphaerae bacterium]NIU10589.1 hypothetical protein [Phycisphaerae bacterium]NIU58333.1 hypothetical protein [Phycisphaerae bacterium]